MNCLLAISHHFDTIKGNLKLNYNEKKQLRLDDINKELWGGVMKIFDDTDSPLNIIKGPISGALVYYIERNTMLFGTRGATLDWDKKLLETKGMLDDMNTVLESSYDYLKRILESSLLE